MANTTIRRVLGAIVLVVASLQVLGAAPASADASYVGGGAAGVQVSAVVDSGAPGIRSAHVLAAAPAVTLPAEGSNQLLVDELGDEVTVADKVFAQLGIAYSGVRVTTKGNLQGNPYAESTATVDRVQLQNVEFPWAHTWCRWDDGSTRATTTLTLPNGRTVSPEPNTGLNIPGLGAVILNHQTLTTRSDGSQVITVAAVHLAANSASGGVTTFDEGAAVAIDIAWSSCDPNKLPLVTGAGVSIRETGSTHGVTP